MRLVRLAVCEAAGLARRQALHRALAEALPGVPDRRCWPRFSSLGMGESVDSSAAHE